MGSDADKLSDSYKDVNRVTWKSEDVATRACKRSVRVIEDSGPGLEAGANVQGFHAEEGN